MARTLLSPAAARTASSSPCLLAVVRAGVRIVIVATALVRVTDTGGAPSAGRWGWPDTMAIE
jgi:hypothetical protein